MYYDLYHKMQYMCKFYLQIFTGVECAFLLSHGICRICKRFRPKSCESCPHLWSQPLVIRARSSSKLAGGGGTKTLSLTYPNTEKSRDVKLGDRGGQAIVPPRPVQATTVRLATQVRRCPIVEK
jgi:hypothetical protein